MCKKQDIKKQRKQWRKSRLGEGKYVFYIEYNQARLL